LEWGQYLLLSNGDAEMGVPNDQEGGDPTNANFPEPKQKKSVIFRMIKPFLKARKRVFGRKSSREKKDTEMSSCTRYEPPTTTVEDGVSV
jgi:hypothetical protein